MITREQSTLISLSLVSLATQLMDLISAAKFATLTLRRGKNWMGHRHFDRGVALMNRRAVRTAGKFSPGGRFSRLRKVSDL